MVGNKNTLPAPYIDQNGGQQSLPPYIDQNGGQQKHVTGPYIDLIFAR